MEIDRRFPVGSRDECRRLHRDAQHNRDDILAAAVRVFIKDVGSSSNKHYL